MENVKEQKGITLVALIITIAILLILAAVSIQSGTESVDKTKLKGFYTQLEVIQKRVDDISTTNETYVDDNGNQVYLKEQGEDLSETQKSLLQDILATEEITNFRYFTIKDLEDILDILHMEYNVFIDFENRIIVAEEGITIGDETYHVLPNTTYFVEEDTTKNIGTIETLEYTVVPYGKDKYKVTIRPTNTIGDVGGNGYVRYKKATSKYWEDSNNLEIIVKLDTEYNIQYIDANNNKIEKTIKLEIDTVDNTKIAVREVESGQQQDPNPEVELAYFHNSGTVCDTGIVANNRYTIEIDFEYTTELINGSAYLWGVRHATNGTQFHSLQTAVIDNVIKFRAYSNDKPIVTSFSPELNKRYHARVSGTGSNMTLEINNEMIGSVSFSTVAPITYYLGGLHREGYTVTGPAGDFLLYSFKIYDTDGTTLLCNYIPQKVGEEIKLYDTVRNQYAEWFS